MRILLSLSLDGVPAKRGEPSLLGQGNAKRQGQQHLRGPKLWHRQTRAGHGTSAGLGQPRLTCGGKRSPADWADARSQEAPEVVALFRILLAAVALRLIERRARRQPPQAMDHA
jgi:hypothetical protein